MKKSSLILIILVAAAVLCWLFVVPHPNKHRAIAGVPEPVQEKTSGGIKKELDNYSVTISYLYTYDIKALVVHTKDYEGTTMETQLAPRDLALAWGDVAANNDTVDFNWTQSGRFANWYVRSNEDIDRLGGVDAISRQASNNHVIPANDVIEKQIKKIKTGDYIRLKGYLVSIKGKRGDGADVGWDSSTTREDTGDGACEVIYVTNVTWIGK